MPQDIPISHDTVPVLRDYTEIVRFKKSKLVAHVKGHAVECLEEEQDKEWPVYRYKDDNTLVPDDHWAQRPCKMCHKKPTADGHDPCIANLPGVEDACCGHGMTDGYLSFANGVVLRMRPVVIERREVPARVEDDETLSDLAHRLKARARTAAQAGDHEMAIEMKAASVAVHATDFLSMALSTMEIAHEEWEKLRDVKLSPKE